MVVTILIANKIDLERGLFIGYATMVVSFLLVYFGIRSYRDNVNGGHITFGKAFAVGICIAVISSLCYVITWEIVYYNFMPDFLDKYCARVLAKMQASGASAAAIQAQIEQSAKMKEMYKSPLGVAALTFLEPFPVGLVITLISAAVLRRKAKPQTT